MQPRFKDLYGRRGRFSSPHSLRYLDRRDGGNGMGFGPRLRYQNARWWHGDRSRRLRHLNTGWRHRHRRLCDKCRHGRLALGNDVSANRPTPSTRQRTLFLNNKFLSTSQPMIRGVEPARPGELTRDWPIRRSGRRSFHQRNYFFTALTIGYSAEGP
jgi:hypothetical protein